MKVKNTLGILQGFIASLKKFPDRPALKADEITYTYKEVHSYAGKIADAIKGVDSDNQINVAILANKSITTYASILGTLVSQNCYVPINPKFPTARNVNILKQAECDILIADNYSIPKLAAIVDEIDYPITIILPNITSENAVLEENKIHQIVYSDQFNTMPIQWESISIEKNDPAYLLFTSGSTGIPKGIQVSHENILAYVSNTIARYDFKPTDRITQTFDLTFDLSVHDMFICWEVGACLCPIPNNQSLVSAKFIKENKISCWFSVPSMAVVLSKMKMLKHAMYPDLRISLFCGEPLSVAIAEQWALAAPNSIIESLYGPTEATIAIANYKINDQLILAAKHDIVPIGYLFKNQEFCVVNNSLVEVNVEESGELCLSGTQVTKGYWKNDEKTKKQYVTIFEKGETIWYRTGDLVRQDKTGCLHFLGRTDHQVKINGFRVELQEIEAAIKEITRAPQVIVLAWPLQNNVTQSLVAFISQMEGIHAQQVIQSCKKKLPTYMVPSRILFLTTFPVNVTGKIDRKELINLLEKNG